MRYDRSWSEPFVAAEWEVFLVRDRQLHRDLKPSSIMVDRFGEVQVMDWGLAKILAYPRNPKSARVNVAGLDEWISSDGSPVEAAQKCLG